MKQEIIYKKVNLPWLKEIPNHWEIKKLKYLIREKIKDGPHETPQFTDKGIPFLSVDSIQKGEIVFEDCRFISPEAHKEYQKKCTINKEDILIGKAASIGKIARVKVDFEFSVWSPLAVIKNNKKVEATYLEYALKSPQTQYQIEILCTSNTQKNISMDDIPKIILSLPKPEEQKTIVNFLNAKMQQIDSLIEKRKQMIELLQEEKIAVINHAITKGINPKTKMKDSEIEWLGKVPEHWNVNKFRRVCYMKGRIGWQGLKQLEFIDEGPYLITGMNFKDGIIRWNEVYHITEERYKEAPEIQLKEGDVLMTKDGTIGKLLFVNNLPGKASLNSHLLLMRSLNNEFTQKYLYFILQSEYFKGHIDTNKTGTTFFGITQEEVGTFKMLLPPVQEQEQIVKHIEIETSKIDKTLSQFENEIALLQEYKTALISEAVTGKIDVREEVKHA
jgi:type I restriction enzyme, S subunit